MTPEQTEKTRKTVNKLNRLRRLAEIQAPEIIYNRELTELFDLADQDVMDQDNHKN